MCVFCKGTDDFAVVRVDLPFVAHVAGDGETHCAAVLANQLFEMGFRLLLSMLSDIIACETKRAA
jgi:hypothetical protein